MKRVALALVSLAILIAPLPATAAQKAPPGFMYITKCHIKAVGRGRAVRRCSQFMVVDPNSPEQKSIRWAKKQVGKTRQPNGRYWALWCDRFVGSAYGRVPSGFVSAKTHYWNLKRRGSVKTKGTPPAGALVFYEGYNGFGHVALSLGDGRVVTTPSKPGRPVFIAPTNVYRHYLGWSYANPEWRK